MAKCRGKKTFVWCGACTESSCDMFYNYEHVLTSANTWQVPLKHFLSTFCISCCSAHVPLRTLCLWCLLILTCSAFLIMFQRWWLKSWFSSWLMLYNWAGYLLLVSDERSPLIHSWSATFDGTCFNLLSASPVLILKLRFTDEGTQSWKNRAIILLK